MIGLTTALLGRAFRTFLTLAYPGGEHSIPRSKAAYLHVGSDQPLEAVLIPPLCQTVPAPGGGVRGYAFRLGCVHFPHLKMQVIDCDNRGTLVFAVDTHDIMRLDPAHPDVEALALLQAANRGLKEQIERAWEAEGLLTFNALLRRDLEKPI